MVAHVPAGRRVVVEPVVPNVWLEDRAGERGGTRSAGALGRLPDAAAALESGERQARTPGSQAWRSKTTSARWGRR